MGREARFNAAGRPFVLSRKEMLSRVSKSVLHILGAGAVTVTASWCDEHEDQLTADTHCTTVYGDTSTGRPIGSFPGELPGQIALGHLGETLALVANQKAPVEAALAKIRASLDDLKAAPGPKDDTEQPHPPPEAPPEVRAEVVPPDEGADPNG